MPAKAGIHATSRLLDSGACPVSYTGFAGMTNYILFNEFLTQDTSWIFASLPHGAY
jgi:hypothetical protein